METVCKICGCPLLDDQNIARDNFGVNLEVHADCLAALTPASDGRAEGLREAAEILTVAAKAYEELRTSFSQKDISLETAERWLLAERDAILARAAELEKADE